MNNNIKELREIINYLMDFTKIARLYVNIAEAFNDETLLDLDSKTLLNLGCNPICYSVRREGSTGHVDYDLYYQCNDLIVNLKYRSKRPAGFPDVWCEEEPTSLFVKIGVAKPKPRSNFFVNFGSLIGSIEIGLKDEVSISLGLDDFFFTRIERIYRLVDDSISIIAWESRLRSYIGIDIKPSEGNIERKSIEITPYHEYKEYMEKLVNNPENAYKLATSLLMQLYNNSTFRSNMDKVISFLRRFLKTHVTMILY